MSWQLEGLFVEANYLDLFPVVGKVELSRVAYGGMVNHTLVLQTPIEVYGSVRDRVIIKHTEIQRVMSNLEVV